MTYSRSRPTIYKGIRMRSRLEASFAAKLDRMEGVAWAYEPQCFADATGQYLPDFLVTSDKDGDRDYIEVKPPNADMSAALHRMHIIRSSEPQAFLYVVTTTGVYPRQGWETAKSCNPNMPCHHCTGPVYGWKKCSQEETDAFLADRPWP